MVYTHLAYYYHSDFLLGKVFFLEGETKMVGFVSIFLSIVI